MFCMSCRVCLSFAFGIKGPSLLLWTIKEAGLDITYYLYNYLFGFNLAFIMLSSIASASRKAVTSASVRSFHSAGALRSKLSVGDRLPSVELDGESPAEKIDISKFAEGKKVVIFGVPGAFTPGCSKTHLPGYLKDFDALRSKGVEDIACVSVNDAFVMNAWGEANNVGDKIKMLADTNAEFSKAIGTDFDVAVLGGVRSKRFAMVVDNGVVKAFNVEPDNTGLSCSLSENIIKSL
eukprot:Nk52_evm30s222 gene=Nk52_evmTU30s222